VVCESLENDLSSNRLLVQFSSLVDLSFSWGGGGSPFSSLVSLVQGEPCEDLVKPLLFGDLSAVINLALWACFLMAYRSGLFHQS